MINNNGIDSISGLVEQRDVFTALLRDRDFSTYSRDYLREEIQALNDDINLLSPKDSKGRISATIKPPMNKARKTFEEKEIRGLIPKDYSPTVKAKIRHYGTDKKVIEEQTETVEGLFRGFLPHFQNWASANYAVELCEDTRDNKRGDIIRVVSLDYSGIE